MWWLAALALAQPDLSETQWAIFTVARYRTQEGFEVRVGTLPSATPEARLDFWFQLRIEAPERPDELSWTDTRGCPAARAALGEMADVRPPRYHPPGFDDTVMVLLHSDAYTLRATARFEDGQLSEDLLIQSGAGTSLARWVERMLEALRPCWSSRPPQAAESAVTSH